ncbi:hypothetical protein J7373_05890 [Xanthomonas sp. A2111]|uniref:Transposase n=1 Tax=Xanthomonas hawaiiensis TaxID=3003247 RepID=A0ABU2I7K7_9XANT|nr:hypothetical protein [Xanthomonas sp. A2111]MBO9827779.1 hypothetical protein [Xanthomonas sp. A2111]MDS9994131.1 hypothetical protein [Xanthomonas sp. A2111]
MNSYQWSEETTPRPKKAHRKPITWTIQPKSKWISSQAYSGKMRTPILRSAIVLRRILIGRINMPMNDRGKNPKHLKQLLYVKQIAPKVDHPFDAFVGNQK